MAHVGALARRVRDHDARAAERDRGVRAAEGRRAEASGLGVVQAGDHRGVGREADVARDLWQDRAEGGIDRHELGQFVRVDAGVAHEPRVVAACPCAPVVGHEEHERRARVGGRAPGQSQRDVVGGLEERRRAPVHLGPRVPEIAQVREREAARDGRQSVDAQPAQQAQRRVPAARVTAATDADDRACRGGPATGSCWRPAGDPHPRGRPRNTVRCRSRRAARARQHPRGRRPRDRPP